MMAGPGSPEANLGLTPEDRRPPSKRSVHFIRILSSVHCRMLSYKDSRPPLHVICQHPTASYGPQYAPVSNQKEMFSSDDIWLFFNWGVGGWGGGKKRPQGNIRGQVRAFVVEQRTKSEKAEPLLRIVWSKSRNKLIKLNYFMLSFKSMKFHGMWALDIRWIISTGY